MSRQPCPQAFHCATTSTKASCGLGKYCPEGTGADVAPPCPKGYFCESPISKSPCPAATEWHSCKFRRSTVSPNSLCGRYFTTKFRDFGTVCHGLAMPDIEEAYRERPKMCGFKRTNLPLNHKYDPICQDTFPDDFVTTFVAYTASNNESAARDAFRCGRSTSSHTMISACALLAMAFARLL